MHLPDALQDADELGLLAATGSTLTSLHGIGAFRRRPAARGSRDITRFPAKAHFASWNGTAPTGRLLR